jgi:hypothetical protein
MCRIGMLRLPRKYLSVKLLGLRQPTGLVVPNSDLHCLIDGDFRHVAPSHSRAAWRSPVVRFPHFKASVSLLRRCIRLAHDLGIDATSLDGQIKLRAYLFDFIADLAGGRHRPTTGRKL